MNVTDYHKILEDEIPVPINLPKIYFLGDTGSGKTTTIRQILGTTNFSFPSVRRVRTTVTRTEYIVCNEGGFSSVLVLKSIEEIQHYIREILENSILSGYKEFANKKDCNDTVSNSLKESPDQRFRLRYILNENERNNLSHEIIGKIFPLIKACNEKNFPNETDNETMVELSFFDNEINSIIEGYIIKIIENINSLISTSISKEFSVYNENKIVFNETDIDLFINKLKNILDAGEGSISPIIECARIKGKLKANWIPHNFEFLLIDSEGIGHDMKEVGKPISSRHLQFFYNSHEIVLVEDGERPFIGGGKTALTYLQRNGYISKTTLAFSKLDKISENRNEQISEVNDQLRNLINTIQKDEKVDFQDEILQKCYFANMEKNMTDTDTQSEIINLFKRVIEKAQKGLPKFIKPIYDFEMLSTFLDQANAEFRTSWTNYLTYASPNKKPWQTVKAFNFRMYWGVEEYKDMRPIADLHYALIRRIEKYISNPKSWEENIVGNIKTESINRLKQVFSLKLMNIVNNIIITKNQSEWKLTSELTGYGSTFERAEKIKQILNSSVPSMTELFNATTSLYKDIVKDCLIKSINELND